MHFPVTIVLCILTRYNSDADIKSQQIGNDVGNEGKDGTDIMLVPHESWNQYLRATPYTIALIGQLMLVATQNDFRLAETTQEKGFKRLKYPNSFRASLVQLTNIGWEAYNGAHVNMDSIQLLTSNIESYVQSLVKVMAAGSPDEIKTLVPLTLNKIQRMADKCVSLSSEVENKFVLFMETVGELLEACTVAQGVYEEKSKETEMAITAAKNEQMFAKQEKRNLEKQYEDIAEELRHAHEDFRETLKSSPSTTKLLSLGLLDSIWGIVDKIIGSRDIIHEQFREHEESESEEDRSRAHAFHFADEIEGHIQTLADVATSGKEQGHKEPNLSEIDSVRVAKHSLLIISKNLNRDSLHTDAHEEGTRLCNDAVRLCEQLVEISKDMKPQKEHITSIIIETEDLLLASKQFSVDATNFLHSRGPRMKHYFSAASSSLLQSELRKYEVNIEVAKDIVRDTRKKEEELVRSLKKNNARTEETLRELAKIQIEKVDFMEIKKTLQRGIQAIQEVREQWGLVVMMFKTISERIKLKFHIKISDLIDISNEGLTQSAEKGEISSFVHKQFFHEVLEVSKMTYAVHAISSTYVEISSKYLIEDINSLGGLAALDPRTQQNEIEKKRHELNENCQRASNAISHILLKNFGECNEKVRALKYENP